MRRLINTISSLVLFLFLNFTSQAQEINAEEITVACGNKYFSIKRGNQPPLVVRGKWCSDFYFWSPVNIGDTLLALGFLNDELFTGNALAYDSLDNVIASYNFENGLLQKMEEYLSKDKLRLILNMKNGIPPGVQRRYNYNGELTMEQTFQEGILNGPLYWLHQRESSGFIRCIEIGNYLMGKYEKINETCD